MKVVILAGGLGTRLSEETHLKPKPMVEIGGKPILWHILKIYHFYGFKDFIVCCGYKGNMIKEYFNNYMIYNSDITIDMQNDDIIFHKNRSEDWKITLIDTGALTQTGGRLKRIQKYLNRDEDFCFTYGDGLGDINIEHLVSFHKSHGKLATLTAARLPGRFGALSLSGDQITSFTEKPQGDGAYINAGFFVLSPKVIDLIDGDDTIWEREPLEFLSSNRELMAFKHDKFWKPMDTIRDKHELNQLWGNDVAPWRIW